MPDYHYNGSLDRMHLDQWWGAHSLLDECVRRVDQATSRGSLSSARVALDEFEDALDGHFEVEECIYFPLIERHAPAERDRVHLARKAHATIRAQLEKLQEFMAVGERRTARVCLGALLDSFREHEVAESLLIDTLETLVDDREPAG